jgi:hypothetical protein
MRLFVTVAACLLALSGCSSGGPAKQAPGLPLPAGFKRIGGPANGLSVGVPEAWTVFDPDEEDVRQRLAEGGLSGRSLDEAMAMIQEIKARKAIYALDPESAKQSPRQFPTNINGFCQERIGASADALIDLVKKQLATVNASVIDARQVPLTTTTAVRVKYVMPRQGVLIRGSQYYVPLDNGKTCIITITTDLEGKDQLFDQIGGTASPA